MSDQTIGLLVSCVVAALIFTIGLLIRVRGPVGLLKNIDWSRVSDPQGLGQFTSLMLSVIAALIAGHGMVLFAFHDDRASRNIGTTAFVVLIALCSVTQIVGQLRYQDKTSERRRRDGR